LRTTFQKSKRRSLGTILFIFLLFSFCLAGCGISSASNNEQGQLESANPGTQGSTQPQFSEKLEVHFLDVGQADSILVQLPNSQTMLIDAGNNPDANFVVDYIKEAGVKKIDYLVGTHPHEDHIGGLDLVIKSFDIGRVIMPNITHTTKTFKDVLLAVQDKELKITKAEAGKMLLDESGLTIKILAPKGTDYKDLNNYSSVIKITFGNTGFLFQGDAEDLIEDEILTGGTDVKADVLKIGHHGSNSSSTKAYLEAVNPTYTVISVGAGNDYGHPHQETLDRLKNAGVQIYRTDIMGTLIFTSDGNKITVSESNKRHSD